jgi:hypothetical protein
LLTFRGTVFSLFDVSFNSLAGNLAPYSLSFIDGGVLNMQQNGFRGYPPTVLGAPVTVNFGSNAFALPLKSSGVIYDLPASVQYALFLDTLLSDL